MYSDNVQNSANTFSNLPAEKLHIKFCKTVLGVNKKATNLATLSELGRFPLHYDVIKSMLKYWHRLENLGSLFPLLRDAYLESQSLHNLKIQSWYGSIAFVLRHISGINNLKKVSPYKFTDMYKKHLNQYYIENWLHELKNSSEGKLCSYVKFKCNFGLEPYLMLLRSPEHRKNFTRLRISAHKLAIEQGRYQGTPRQNRTCLRCSSGEVDDETHFLFSCKFLEDSRNNMIESALSECPNFRQLSDSEKLIWILNTENVEVLIKICELIKESKI